MVLLHDDRVPPAVLMNQQEQQQQLLRDQQEQLLRDQQEQLLHEQQEQLRHEQQWQQAMRDQQQQQQQPPRNNPGEVVEPQVNAVGNCKLPAFWRGNPELYFFQVESLFHIHHVTNDATKYHMVVAMLDPESITEVSDIIRAPPREDKYNTLKETLLRRLTDPPDVQLHQLLPGVELGDKRPSQLLLHMRTLAGSRVSDDILRVRWLDLLPEQTRRLLLLIRNQSLDELAAVADEAHAMGPSVMSAGYRPQQPTSAPSLSFAAGSPDPVAQELAELRLAIVQLTAITRESLQSGRSSDHRSNDHRSNNPRSRSRSRGRQESRPRAATPGPGTRQSICWYHSRYEVLALYSTAGAGKSMERRLYIFDRGSNIRFLVDSGSVVSIVPRKFIRRPLQRQALRLQAANGTPIATYGNFDLTLNLGLRRPYAW
ncbi:hypothetical protein TKK_0003382 [Trichogramma kaykai]|uniref:DUF7041 domain-containing protein n=1 Tax=Trichogramma kaykai TaxID=54128 RepID=A0ABD2XQP1_9HYME